MNLTKIVFFIILLPSLAKAMDTTFQTPSVAFVQPRFARKNLTTFEFYTSTSYAHESFDAIGNVVPLLNFNGPQTLYKRFVDVTLPRTDTSNFGSANLPAQLQSTKYNFRFIQNLGQHWFVTWCTNIIHTKFKNLLIQPINATCQPLNQAEINAQTGLAQYLQDLRAKLSMNNSGNTLCYHSTGPTYFTVGYTHSFYDFARLDFIDISFATGIFLPANNRSNHPSKHVHFEFPINNFSNFGFPFLASAALGLYDWLNIGVSGLIIPFLQNTQYRYLNTTETNNMLLLQDCGAVQVKPGPFIYLNAYLEADQMIPHLTFLAGLSYIKQCGFKIHERLGGFFGGYRSFSDEILNQSPSLRSWQTLNLTVSAELDLSKKHHSLLPRIKFVYVCPLTGRSAFKTSAFAGQVGLEIAYDF
jgi:hypothetical protein